jgi:hypothetical protein
MWNYSEIILWPLMGPLPGRETTGWTSDRLLDMLTIPEIYIPEIIGLVILAILFYRLVKNRNVTGFIREGTLD